MKFPRLVTVRIVFVLICLYLTIVNVKVFSVVKICNFVRNDLTEKRCNNRKSTDSILDIIDDFLSDTSGLMSETRTFVRTFSNLTALSDSINRVQNNMRKLASDAENYLSEIDTAKFLSQPVINFHNFTYIHNPSTTCLGKEILVVVPSAVGNFEKRLRFRSYFSENWYRDISTLRFFIGKCCIGKNTTKLQKEVNNEVDTFRDIVQEDFEDVYSNNRLKQVSVLRWISTYCTNIKYIIRADDDIRINMAELLPVLRRTAQTMENFIIGRKRENDSPARDVKSKYYLSEKEYPPPTFPPYLLGGLLGYPISTGKLLYQAALRTKPIWLEDVFITGLCAPKVHVPILTDPAFLFYHKNE